MATRDVEYGTFARRESKSPTHDSLYMAVLCVVVAVILFSQVPAVVTYLNHIDPTLFIPCHVLCSGNVVGLVGFPLVYHHQMRWDFFSSITRTEWAALLLSSVFYTAVGPALQLLGLLEVSVTTMAVLQRLESVNYMVLTAMLLPTDPPSRWAVGNAMATVVTVLGYAIFALATGGSPHGMVFIVVAGWAFSSSLLLTKGWLTDVPLGIVALCRVVFGTIFYHIYSLAMGMESLTVLYSTTLWTYMLPYGVVYVVFGQAVWLRGLRDCPPVILSVATTALLPLQVLWAEVIVGESPLTGQLIVAGILVGVVVSGACETYHTTSKKSREAPLTPLREALTTADCEVLTLKGI